MMNFDFEEVGLEELASAEVFGGWMIKRRESHGSFDVHHYIASSGLMSVFITNGSGKALKLSQDLFGFGAPRESSGIDEELLELAKELAGQASA